MKTSEKRFKCPICDRLTIAKKSMLPLYGGTIVVNSSAEYCKYCKEYFYTSKQAGTALEKASMLRKSYHTERSIRRSGRGYVIPIPKDFLVYYKVEAGEPVDLVPIGPKKMLVEFK